MNFLKHSANAHDCWRHGDVYAWRNQNIPIHLINGEIIQELSFPRNEFESTSAQSDGFKFNLSPRPYIHSNKQLQLGYWAKSYMLLFDTDL